MLGEKGMSQLNPSAQHTSCLRSEVLRSLPWGGWWHFSTSKFQKLFPKSSFFFFSNIFFQQWMVGEELLPPKVRPPSTADSHDNAVWWDEGSLWDTGTSEEEETFFSWPSRLALMILIHDVSSLLQMQSLQGLVAHTHTHFIKEYHEVLRFILALFSFFCCSCLSHLPDIVKHCGRQAARLPVPLL